MKKRKENSFTIIELLVVISIIVILAGLLLPSLKKAKDAVQRIACVNKLKQMHISGEGYVQDYNGYICAGKPYVGRYWFDEAGERMGKDKNFFVCPAESRSVGTYTHYAINSKLVGLGLGYAPSPSTFVRKVSSVLQPSITLWIVENNRSSFASDDRTYVAFRHGALSPAGQANFLYFDGHVKPMKYLEMGPGQTDFEKGF